MNALVNPCVTCDLPTSPVPFNVKWQHLDRLPLADPEFGALGRIDILLGIDVFSQVLLNGRRKGCRGSPAAMETIFEWVLCGDLSPDSNSQRVTTYMYHSTIRSSSDDDIIHKFWEIEETPNKLESSLSIEERSVVNHYKTSHIRKPVHSTVA